MRKELEKIGRKYRHVFTAEFVRFGSKRGYEGRKVRTILLKDVKCGDSIVTDHIWFTMGKQFEDLQLASGDRIEFFARVAPYIKGYRGYREDVWDKPVEQDWRLSFPTKIRKLSKNEVQETLL